MNPGKWCMGTTTIWNPPWRLRYYSSIIAGVARLQKHEVTRLASEDAKKEERNEEAGGRIVHLKEETKRCRNAGENEMSYEIGKGKKKKKIAKNFGMHCRFHLSLTLTVAQEGCCRLQISVENCQAV